MIQTASVILDIPTQALDSPYAYGLADGCAADGEPVSVGNAVLVPLGSRKAVGFVIAVDRWETEAACPVDPRKLKGVTRVLAGPFFDEEGAACAQFLADRYIAPLSACVRLFTPPGGVPHLVNGPRGQRLEAPAVGEVEERWAVLTAPAEEALEQLSKTAVKQRQVVEALAAAGGSLNMGQLNQQVGSASAPCKALADRGLVAVEARRRMRGAAEALPEGASVQEPLPLLPDQQNALKVINEARAARDGSVVVLDGVTGSGKTEVYLQAISAVLAEGRTAIVLVPEISLTPQTVGRFRARFGNRVAVMHSRMSAGERFDQWQFIQSGGADVVVGARSALFAPLANVGLVVIDEEHESTYKQESQPRYRAVDVALWMMERAGGTVVLGSATPSIETLERLGRDGRWRRAAMPHRTNGKPLPPIEVVDMAREFSAGSRSMFSGALTCALADTLAAGRKAVLLLNQRGFAKFLLCRDCGFVPSCPSCATSLTYHEDGAKLVCHHCGYSAPVPPKCPECGSPYLKKFGAGTQRVEADLRALLDAMPEAGPEVPIIRMDADTTRFKGAHERLLQAFGAQPRAVLLGTQMIAKGLDFDDVALVGVINADTQLNLPDFRAAERTFNLIEQVAGRAGRGDVPGQVLVQTYEPSSAAIMGAARYARDWFVAGELQKRRLFSYPPYVRMANILIWGPSLDDVKDVAAQLHRQLEVLIRDQVGDSWQLLAPVPCVLERLRGAWRWHIVVKCPQGSDISPLLLGFFRQRKADKRANVAVDIDPLDLL
ncbi:replication restart helicase PriA [Parvibacter caecicola]|uniref:Replication restart protein PriA n=1 Tax=Parvibacter caecicola TaxID=747645 RepID=A0A7W5GNX8_9ACTN|nr:primosomal protein N' [Parvibacter caecicola]MBB3170552.1 primosomal protein N' (replication factor Y) [Parvibacter caecicola]MCR2041487.1 primosomal protein N' [Parvibacter caecicola]